MVGPGQNKGESLRDLDRESERQVAIKALDSLFHVEVNLRKPFKEEQGNPAAKSMYETISYNVVQLEELREDVEIERSPDAITCGTVERHASGFAIKGKGNKLRILTCAHTLEDVFTKGAHDLTVDQVNTMFRFDVHCIHHEAGILKMVSRLKPSERKRDVTVAVAVAIDTKLDLLVLEVDVEQLCGDNEVICSAKHPEIQLAESNPTELQKLILPGWPPQRCKALAIGQVSLCDWIYDAISSSNVKGYTMKFLEIPGMAASNGFSGGPVLGMNGCVALYHGVFDGITGYGVSLQDLHTFLRKHKMLHWPEAKDSEDDDSDYEISRKRKRTPVKTPVKSRTPVKTPVTSQTAVKTTVKRGTPGKRQKAK
ncbi:unnamed protein product [Urochloa decumbens]|uniref:Uncharacterized protein n=1 Tax=Urochloa decumbens TaxID=240449 RepID=A0ABC9CRI7_9POAL